MVGHLDVGSSHPGAGEGPKGWAVRPLKWHASWGQNVVRQFGLYLSWAYEICVALTLVREDRVGLTAGLPEMCIRDRCIPLVVSAHNFPIHKKYVLQHRYASAL